MQNRGQIRTRAIRPSGIVEGETWPVGASSPRGARLISAGKWHVARPPQCENCLQLSKFGAEAHPLREVPADPGVKQRMRFSPAAGRRPGEGNYLHNRMHGSMRRREATQARRASTRPCGRGCLPPTLHLAHLATAEGAEHDTLEIVPLRAWPRREPALSLVERASVACLRSRGDRRAGRRDRAGRWRMIGLRGRSGFAPLANSRVDFCAARLSWCCAEIAGTRRSEEDNRHEAEGRSWHGLLRQEPRADC